MELSSPGITSWRQTLSRRPQLDLFDSPQAPGAPRVHTVKELAKRIKGTLEGTLGTLHVRGEISNLRRPGSGHLYFSLKDEGASIRAVLFRGQARLLRFRPEAGQEVVATGRVTFYEAGGDAQIVCDTLEPVGAGALALAFEQRKAKLAKEGLFDRERKRPMPFLPRRIGVVTSPTGAAIRDFLQVLHRRFRGIEVLIAPSRVQGAGAAEEIAAGIQLLGASGGVDVVVVTRGGGSVEDLWAFNEEVVARAIAASPIPVVSAVGHEVDFTIADFVADLRAPTPTAAAELLAPVESDLREGIAIARARLARGMARGLGLRRGAILQRRSMLGDPRRLIVSRRLDLDGKVRHGAEVVRRSLSREWRRLEDASRRLGSENPTQRLRAHRRKLVELRGSLHDIKRTLLRDRSERVARLSSALWRADPSEGILRRRAGLAGLEERLAHRGRERLHGSRQRLAELRGRLGALSPLAVLARGYAIAFTEGGAIVHGPTDAQPGDRLHLELGDGALEVQVVGVAARRSRGSVDRGESGR